MASRSHIAIWEQEALEAAAKVACVDISEELYNHHHRHEAKPVLIARLLEGLAEEVVKLQDRVAELEKAAAKDAA